MRAVVQRVTKAKVTIAGRVSGRIGAGYLVLLGVGHNDNGEKTKKLADKILNLRVMADDQDKMNQSIKDTRGELLVVSQFTLYGDTRKGNRPSFVQAATPELGKRLYNLFVDHLRQSGLRVETGEFGAKMAVGLVNDGPVTILIET